MDLHPLFRSHIDDLRDILTNVSARTLIPRREAMTYNLDRIADYAEPCSQAFLQHTRMTGEALFLFIQRLSDSATLDRAKAESLRALAELDIALRKAGPNELGRSIGF